MIGSRLRSARVERGHSQQSMADLLGITRAAYARYENETSEPSFANLKKLCSTLDVSSDWLLDTGHTAKIETTKDALVSVMALQEAGASVSSGLLTIDVDLSEIGKDELSQQVPVVLLVLEDHDLYGSVRILNIMEDAIDSSETPEERFLNEEAFARYLEGQLQHLADKKLSIPISPNLAEKILKQVKNIHFKD